MMRYSRTTDTLAVDENNLGEAVGEAVEETGEAIEPAGEAIKEESQGRDR